VCISWNNKKCCWYYWCTVQTWRCLQFISDWMHEKCMNPSTYMQHFRCILILIFRALDTWMML